ncbi:hypothetical protein [Helicobacter ganmani]|uniref:hypothetical protein n=1 Tax=Helicobacter ganmani TaxID=60246 RepID=UPI003A8B6EA6
MNLALLTLAGVGITGAYFGYKKKDPSVSISNCFLDKLASPLYNLFVEYHSNSLFLVDSIKEDYILCNTPYDRLYGIEITSSENIQKYIQAEKIKELVRDSKESEDGFFYYVLFKQEKCQKQYIFSHSKIIIQSLANYFDLRLLSGLELTNVLYNLFLQNNFYQEDKQLKQALTIKKDTLEAEPEFLSFKRLAKQAIANNHKNVKLFQAYKHLEIKQSEIQSLFSLNFKGAIWFYIDLSSSHIKNHISRLLNYAKLVGDKKPFIELEQSYHNKECDLALINAVAYLEKYDEEIIGQLGSSLKVSFIEKELLRSNHLQKNPIKFRDSEFDFLVKEDFLFNFIASIHKKDTFKPDIFGVDKNGGFINYSFSAENDNPHIAIIAKPGSGKSVSKQKIMAQMIGLNFSNGICLNLGKEIGQVRIRSYDIGFSDEKFINLIKSNPNNSVAHIESDFYGFSYNLVNLPSLDNMELFEADLQFNIDLASVVLESQNAEPLSIAEVAHFKEIVKKVYKTKQHQRYRVRDLKQKTQEAYNKLLSLGYEEVAFLDTIQEEEFDYLKKPLLIDIVKFARKESANMQLKEEERKDYESLARKLDSIEKLDLFSSFDKINIADVDVLSMDLNNFKESSLFTPIFLAIFQKTYLKDREFALKCKREGHPAPKLFYAIEEAKNYFRIPYFTTMFEKVALEARKYNVHLCFVVQNAEHIPLGILKNLDTRIFLLRPDKKLEVIQEAQEALKIPKNVEIGLLNTNKHELCVWYSSGVFNMKFEISKEEMKIFSTNPNEV